MHSAFAGEVRFVVENNGVKKLDTGFNKNLILDQGLHFFGGGNGTDMMQYCLVGAGNSEPAITQTKLENCITGVSGVVDNFKYDYVDDATDTYKCSLTYKYVFTNLAGNNICEVGLASVYSSPLSNYICTRALIKDSLGNATTISLITGDTLTIYYKLWVVHSTLDTNQIINMSDGFGGSELYNVKTRLALVGNDAKWGSRLSEVVSSQSEVIRLNSGDLDSITSNPSGYLSDIRAEMVTYNNDFSRVMNVFVNTSTANGIIRSLMIMSIHVHVFGFHQIRFGRVSDDAPIAKDNTKELTIPIKLSWGRYEGAL